MKHYCTLLVFLVISLTTIAQDRKNISEEEFNRNYANKFTIVGENIELQRIFQFPNIDKEELYRRAKAYLDDRIQKKYASISTNANYSYTDYSLIITEAVDNLRWGKSLPKMNCIAKYIYKLEVKDQRVRATIIFYSLKQPEYHGLELTDLFPFTNKLKRKMRRILADFIDYSDKLFEHTQKGLSLDKLSEDDW